MPAPYGCRRLPYHTSSTHRPENHDVLVESLPAEFQPRAASDGSDRQRQVERAERNPIDEPAQRVFPASATHQAGLHQPRADPIAGHRDLRRGREDSPVTALRENAPLDERADDSLHGARQRAPLPPRTPPCAARAADQVLTELAAKKCRSPEGIGPRGYPGQKNTKPFRCATQSSNDQPSHSSMLLECRGCWSRTWTMSVPTRTSSSMRRRRRTNSEWPPASRSVAAHCNRPTRRMRTTFRAAVRWYSHGRFVVNSCSNVHRSVAVTPASLPT